MILRRENYIPIEILFGTYTCFFLSFVEKDRPKSKAQPGVLFYNQFRGEKSPECSEDLKT